MNTNNIDKNCSYLLFLLFELNTKYPEKQIGKTVVQKLMYLLNRKGIGDYNYTLYHYGPYSTIVSDGLNTLQNQKYIKMKWKDNEGYFIEPLIDDSDCLNLKSTEKETMVELINEYGKNSAPELSVIATSLYLQDKFDIREDDLVEEISQLKPTHSKTEIKNLLERAGVYTYSI